MGNIRWQKISGNIQARIVQLVAYQLGTGEVPGSNPGKGENVSVKIYTIEGGHKDALLRRANVKRKKDKTTAMLVVIDCIWV